MNDKSKTKVSNFCSYIICLLYRKASSSVSSGFSAKRYGIIRYSYDFTIPGIINNKLHKITLMSRLNNIFTTFLYPWSNANKSSLISVSSVRLFKKKRFVPTSIGLRTKKLIKKATIIPAEATPNITGNIVPKLERISPDVSSEKLNSTELL